MKNENFINKRILVYLQQRKMIYILKVIRTFKGYKALLNNGVILFSTDLKGLQQVVEQ